MTARLCVVAAAVIVTAGCGLGDPADTSATSTSTPPSVTYVAIGDGASAETDPGDRREQGWPRLLFRDHLPPQTVFADLARPGATAAEASKEQLPAALELEPTVVTVELLDGDAAAGTSLPQYRSDVDSVVSDLVDAGAQVAVVVDPGAPADYALAAREVATARGATVAPCAGADRSDVAGCVADALGLGP